MLSLESTRVLAGDGPAHRRRAIALLAALAAGVGCGRSAPKIAVAGKKDKTARSRDENKKRKRKNGNKAQGASGSGKQVVKVAQKYKGAEYVWGGASPKGFDCSGFTWYVYEKATGMDIGRTVTGQWKLGRAVGRGDWRAGDIVFFENTFERGLSHNGIYIGDGTFIHAENERTGVVISDLQSGYYDDHYAGARRLL